MTHAANAGKPHVVSGLGSADPDLAAAPKHALSVLQLEKDTYSRSLDCVHCGLCLPACPTYTQNGLEGDSPRGRIYLMKGLADGRIEATPGVVRHLDLCLDCRACETACPSGVVYHELIEETRQKLAVKRSRSFADRVIDFMCFHVFPHPTRLKLAVLPARLLQKFGLWDALTGSLSKVMPAQLQKMQQMLPARRSRVWEKPLKPQYPAQAPDGIKKATVGFFAGCVGSVLYQHVNRQSIRLLQHAGCDVLVVQDQRCCGAIHHHAGQTHHAEVFAKANINAFLPERGTQVDFIVNNIAGCGAMLKDYAHLLRHDAKYADRAKEFVKRTRDISELLVHLKPAPPTRHLNRTVTYHDACHLAHAQKVTQPPRQLLAIIKGLKLVPLVESDMCCGAAGTYNLAEPEMARQLAERKLQHITNTGARVCVTGNVGCAMQIQSEANRTGAEVHVTHPVSLLYEAYFGDDDE